MKLSLSFALSVVLGSTLHAQSFNVDVNSLASPFGKPTNAYGAGSGQVGFWNSMGGVGVFSRLDGTMTFIKALSLGSMFAPAEFDNPLTSGDDQALMDDGVRLNGAASSFFVQINSLQNGAYYVYTYAMAPDAADVSVVNVMHSTTGPLTCGGTWPGQHQDGVTFVRHFVNVTTFDIQIQVHPQTTNGFINGFQ